MSATEARQADAEPLDAGLRLVLPGRRESAGAGWTWVAEGWKLFARAPLMWIVAVVLLFLAAMLLGLTRIGSIIFQLLQAVIAAGFVAVCRTLEKGGEFELEQLFAGFTKRFVPLLIVGVIFVLGMLAIVLVFAAFVGVSFFTGYAAGGGGEDMASAVLAAGGMMIIGALVMLALAIPLLAFYWFAPALVMIHDVKPVAAMKESFSACFRNFIPMLVYGLVMLVALIVALIPLGLGLLVWIPLAVTSTYAAYRRIFTEEASAAPSQAVTPGG